jgi:hypothetical protein
MGEGQNGLSLTGDAHLLTVGVAVLSMEHNDVRKRFSDCPAFQALDEVSRALLFWRAQESALSYGTVVYSQGDALDGCFFLVLTGDLMVEQNGKEVGALADGHIFGEMAFVHPDGARQATIRVASDSCLLLRFELSQAELAGLAFRPLKDYFKSEAWARFVSNAQAGADTGGTEITDPPP